MVIKYVTLGLNLSHFSVPRETLLCCNWWSEMRILPYAVGTILLAAAPVSCMSSRNSIDQKGRYQLATPKPAVECADRVLAWHTAYAGEVRRANPYPQKTVTIPLAGTPDSQLSYPQTAVNCGSSSNCPELDFSIAQRALQAALLEGNCPDIDIPHFFMGDVFELSYAGRSASPCVKDNGSPVHFILPPVLEHQ